MRKDIEENRHLPGWLSTQGAAWRVNPCLLPHLSGAGCVLLKSLPRGDTSNSSTPLPKVPTLNGGGSAAKLTMETKECIRLSNRTLGEGSESSRSGRGLQGGGFPVAV